MQNAHENYNYWVSLLLALLVECRTRELLIAMSADETLPVIKY